jgi:capsular exopolysaccharide synthesis family protein
MQVVVEDPGSPLTEAYRTLRTRIQLSRADGTPLSLLVASPSSRDEQTKVVANLGAVMAQAGLRVFLVDADLRQPQLHRIFELTQEPGLSALTATEAGDCQQHLAETHIPNLCLLSSGSPASDPLGLLGSKRMLRLIEVLKAQADVVLFNAPPILTVADAMVLASRADGTLLVIGSRYTRRGVARRALAMLRSAGAEVWGVVLNGVRTGPFVDSHYADFEELGKHA